MTLRLVVIFTAFVSWLQAMPIIGPFVNIIYFINAYYGEKMRSEKMS